MGNDNKDKEEINKDKDETEDDDSTCCDAIVIHIWSYCLSLSLGYLVCLHCQRCRFHHQLGSNWSSSHSPHHPHLPPDIHHCWNREWDECDGDGLDDGGDSHCDVGDDHLGGQGERGGGGGGGGRGCAGKTANLEDSKSY